MALYPALAALVGRWSGDNAVWLEPGAEPLRSSASAEVSLEAEGQALCVRYHWADGGKPQSGILVLVGEATLTAWAGSWTDSWHYANQLMDVRGTGDGSSVSVRGTYAAPPGPDWGWRLALEPRDAERFTLRMYNIAPEGEEALAVETRLARLA
ncbi:MAG: DUF1579 family protein [Gemmatimonadaceae bacterium]|nr:DUF1579 family protein [Gemmatimonadaceae bacterium]